MPPSRTLGSYSDVLRVWDTAVQASTPIRVRRDTIGDAVRYRQRAYDARTKKRKLTAEQIGLVPGFEPSTPYDGFQLHIEDDKRRRRDPRADAKARNDPNAEDPPASAYYDVVFERMKPAETILDDEGNPIELVELEPYENDLGDLDLE